MVLLVYVHIMFIQISVDSEISVLDEEVCSVISDPSTESIITLESTAYPLERDRCLQTEDKDMTYGSMTHTTLNSMIDSVYATSLNHTQQV